MGLQVEPIADAGQKTVFLSADVWASHAHVGAAVGPAVGETEGEFVGTKVVGEAVGPVVTEHGLATLHS